MNATYHSLYRHSGKFGLHGPILALAAALFVGLPLGYVYAYLINWIPFIYLNFFITLGYGFGFGFLTGFVMKFGNVRNGPVALFCGLAVGVTAWYFSWNAHIHALASGAPWFLYPRQVWGVMKLLYREGSWGIGFSSDSPVTGIPLAIVWLIEAGMIIGLCTVVGYGMIANLPFCEKSGCWLDQERKIDKLDAFTDPRDLAAFQSGDLSPLERARPRVPASGGFARMTLKYSDKCEEFCTVTIENVSVTLDKDGKAKEEKKALLTNLMVPKTMFDHLSRFEHVTAQA